MATTHEFPTDRVHFTWDVGNAPGLTIASGVVSALLPLAVFTT